MGVGAVVLDERLAELVELHAAADAKITELLGMFEEVDPGDREAAGQILRTAKEIGRSGQVREGALVRVLAHAHRVKASRAGLAPFIHTTLDVTDGRARALAKSARVIGLLPELAEPLTSGRIGPGTIGTLTRTACAAKDTDRDLAEILTETLATIAGSGLTEANRQVRILEETITPGHAEQLLARQRQRSFARIHELEDGMCRIEAVLDAERATTFQAAMDATVAAILRERQYDGADPIAADVRSVEQIQAHALTRFAQVYLNATPEQRGASFTPGILYTAQLDATGQPALAETVRGAIVPRDILAPLGNPATHLLEHHHRQPIRFDGKVLDQNPAARLATSAQRTALAWRDRHCTYPGCTRPPTWSLNAHHEIPYSRQGPTVMGNLVLLCSAHHELAHHPGV